MSIYSQEKYDPPPFLRNFTFYEDPEKANSAVRNAIQYANFMREGWRKTASNFELYWNAQSDLLYPRLMDEIRKYKWIPLKEINNDSDAIMVLHQLLLTTTGVSHVLRQDSLNEYIETAKLITDNRMFGGVVEFLRNETLDLNRVERKAFSLLDIFASLAEQLIPVIALKSAGCLDRVDREQFGIMTTSYDALSNFYAKSYEWILDNIDIIISLNNISQRGSYKDCLNDKKYHDVASTGKYNRLKLYLDESEPFSRPAGSLKNRIRNAIQHFNADVDYTSQKITFLDVHAGKAKKEEMYLIDFADICLENFSLIFYILELVYILRKILYALQGEIPSCVL